MSDKSFDDLIAKRRHDLDRCARECVDRMRRWSGMSKGKLVSLDEVAWFATILHAAGLFATTGKTPEQVSKEQTAPNVVTVVTTDAGKTRDYAGGSPG